MSRNPRLSILLLGGLVLLATAGFPLFQTGFVRFQYPPQGDFPVRGVDVARYQEEINWRVLSNDGDIDFAFIKSSEGRDLQDPRFAENWAESEGVMPRGAYHFFTFCTSGEAQARNFLRSAPDPGELPRAIDIEFSGNCERWESEERIRQELRQFVAALAEHDDRPPILYVTKESYERIVRAHFPETLIWMREIVWRPSPSDYPNLTFWQYAGNGRLPGVDRLIDLNVFIGDEVAFEKLIAESTR